jgi:hypothetical protein
MKRQSKIKQPEIKKGTQFTGWAVFNWGISLDRVFRTRKDAKEWCVKNRCSAFGETWAELSTHHKIVKVKCVTL